MYQGDLSFLIVAHLHNFWINFQIHRVEQLVIYIRDSVDFIDKKNRIENIQYNTMLVTTDVIGL